MADPERGTARPRSPPMTTLSHHTGSIEVSLRTCARVTAATERRTPREVQARYAPSGRHDACAVHLRPRSTARASTAPWSTAPVVHWRACVHVRPRPRGRACGSTPASTSACSTGWFGCRPWLAPTPASAGSARDDVQLADRAGDGGGRAVRGGDRVVDQRDRAVARQRPPVQRDAVVHRDRRQGQDVAGEDRGRPERGGAADLPEDVACLCAVDEPHAARRRGDQRRAGLEDEDGVRDRPARRA